jgi:hypothetical protein
MASSMPVDGLMGNVQAASARQALEPPSRDIPRELRTFTVVVAHVGNKGAGKATLQNEGPSRWRLGAVQDSWLLNHRPMNQSKQTASEMSAWSVR